MEGGDSIRIKECEGQSALIRHNTEQDQLKAKDARLASSSPLSSSGEAWNLVWGRKKRPERWTRRAGGDRAKKTAK